MKMLATGLACWISMCATSTGAEKPRVPVCPSGKAPIILGDVSTLSGPMRFPESQEAAANAFDTANAECGIHGIPISYTVLDDAGDPKLSAKLAAELIHERQAVALVGGASTVNCGVSAGLYASAPVAVIPGAGTAPQCFASPNIAPPNTGVFTVTTLALKFAANELASTQLCLVGNAHPIIPGNFAEPVARAERLTGRKVTIVNQELRADSEPTAVLGQVHEAGCDAVFVGTLGSFAAALLKALEHSGDTRLKLVLAPEAYTHDFAARISPALDGRIFSVSEFDFLDSDKPGMRRLRERIGRARIEASPFAVGGYLAAEIIVSVLRGIDGPITQQSVLAVLNKMPGYDTQGLTATPYVFARSGGHRWVPGVRVVVLKNRMWAHATEEWITLTAP